MNRRYIIQGLVVLGCMVSITTAQFASNGQQIIFAGARVYQLEIEGLNHDQKPVIWRTDQIPKRGQTMIWAEGWWFNGVITIRARLEGNRKFECKTGPFHEGFALGFVIARPDGTCSGEQSNRSSEAQKLVRWLYFKSSSKHMEAIRTLLGTANDAWACINTLIDRGNTNLPCRDAKPEAVNTLK